MAKILHIQQGIIVRIFCIHPLASFKKLRDSTLKQPGIQNLYKNCPYIIIISNVCVAGGRRRRRGGGGAARRRRRAATGTDNPRPPLSSLRN